MGSIARFVAGPPAIAAFRDVAAMVQKGGTLDGAGTMEPENDLWVEFARNMGPVAAFPAQSTAAIVAQPERKIKVLDIAAGHGLFGIHVARQNPRAEIFAADWAKVLAVASENANRAGIGDRFHCIPGSAFEVDLGCGYDLVLVPNFFHHFDVPTNINLLKKLRVAMKPDACLATVEFVPNDDRVSPPIAASFSLMMLGRTEHGDAYTLREFERMFQAAGFGESKTHSLKPTPFTLILTGLAEDGEVIPVLSTTRSGRTPNLA